MMNGLLITEVFQDPVQDPLTNSPPPAISCVCTIAHQSVPLAAPLVVPFVANPFPPDPNVNLSLVPPTGATDPRGVPLLDAAAVDSPSNANFSLIVARLG